MVTHCRYFLTLGKVGFSFGNKNSSTSLQPAEWQAKPNCSQETMVPFRCSSMLFCNYGQSTQVVLITVRVRSTREGTVSTGVCLFTFWRGTPSQVWTGGIPSQVQVKGISSEWMGYLLLSRAWWGTPCQGLDGVPPPQQETDHHSEHLLRGGQYASCVHPGGLSCFIICDGKLTSLEKGNSK